MAKLPMFSSEADLVGAYVKVLGQRALEEWTLYHETGGWDLLMVRKSDGGQVGIEAKLTLNPLVLEQCLGRGSEYDASGPDHRAVLVPATGLQNHLTEIAKHLGIVVIRLDRRSSLGRTYFRAEPALPVKEDHWTARTWPHWLPVNRHLLPDYVPDVIGGHAAPVALTHWKILAIKLLLIVDRQGAATRAHMVALKISPTNWTRARYGFLLPSEAGYVACECTPDLKSQHPRAWSEIEADWEKWWPAVEAAAAKVKRKGKDDG